MKAGMGTLEGWKLGTLYRYHHSPAGPTRFELSLDFEPWELADIPAPWGKEDFGTWTDRLQAEGWAINWDTP